MENIKPNKRYLLAEDDDLSLNLSLKTNFNELNEFNNSKIISLTELFTKERNESIKYRIYGNINYFSFLRNKSIDNKPVMNPSGTIFYTNQIIGTIESLFKQVDTKSLLNLENFFDIKLFRLKYIQDSYNSTNSTFVQKLEVLSGDSFLNYFTYSRNLFGERNYHFRFNTINSNPENLVVLSSSTNTNFIYDNNVYIGFIPKVNFNSQTYDKIYYTNDYINEVKPNSIFGYSQKAFTDAQIDLIINGSNFTRDDFKKYFLSKVQIFFRIYNLEISTNNINNNLRFIKNYLDIGNGDYNKKTLNVNIKPFNASTLDLTNLEGDLIYFDKENYKFTEIIKKEYLIKLQLKDTYQGADYNYNTWKNERGYTAYTYTEINRTVNNNFIVDINIDFWFKFSPFHKIELKKYSDFLNEIDTTLSNDIPPNNAVFIGNKYIWRDLLIYGDAENYDYPFVNNNHYIFNDILFYLKPDLSDRNTFILLNEFITSYKINNYTFNTDNIKLNISQIKTIC